MKAIEQVKAEISNQAPIPFHSDFQRKESRFEGWHDIPI